MESVLIDRIFGIRNSSANRIDIAIPMIPITIFFLSPFIREVLNAAADARAYAIVAPTVVTSTIQLMAVLPKKGSISDTQNMAMMAFNGT